MLQAITTYRVTCDHRGCGKSWMLDGKPFDEYSSRTEDGQTVHFNLCDECAATLRQTGKVPKLEPRGKVGKDDG